MNNETPNTTNGKRNKMVNINTKETSIYVNANVNVIVNVNVYVNVTVNVNVYVKVNGVQKEQPTTSVVSNRNP
jgi:hypothetical protein